MKIMSFNTWYGEQEPQLREFLSAKLGEIAVYCFQEAVGDRMERIMTDLFDDNQFDCVKADKKTPLSRYGLRTIVQKPLEISGHQTLFEDDDPDIGQALATEVRLEDGTPLMIVNVHGVPFPGDKLDTPGRLKQTDKIISWQNGSDTPTLICGDFNLLPETESIKRFDAAGCRDLIARYAIQTTRNRHAWEAWPDNRQLFADYAFTSPGITEAGLTVPYTEASDHLPLIVDIDI